VRRQPEKARRRCDRSSYYQIARSHARSTKTVGAWQSSFALAKGVTSAYPKLPAQKLFARAKKLHSIAALQTEYSLWTRDPADKPAHHPRAGVGFVAYSHGSPRFSHGKSSDFFYVIFFLF